MRISKYQGTHLVRRGDARVVTNRDKVIDVAAATHASPLGTGNSCLGQRDAICVSSEGECMQESDAGAETVDPYVREQAVGSSAGLQRECSSSIWGDGGTGQANQCGCQAAGGAFPKAPRDLHGKQPPSDASAEQVEESRITQ
jgi:hypothetical protein